MKDVYYNMGEFSVEIFHDALSEDHLLKLQHEAEEAITEPNDIYEYADCILALFAAAYKAGFTFEQFQQATEDKFEILKTRKWKKKEDGTYQHY